MRALYSMGRASAASSAASAATASVDRAAGACVACSAPGDTRQLRCIDWIIDHTPKMRVHSRATRGTNTNGTHSEGRMPSVTRATNLEHRVQAGDQCWQYPRCCMLHPYRRSIGTWLTT
jgi:hypothetical protein